MLSVNIHNLAYMPFITKDRDNYYLRATNNFNMATIIIFTLNFMSIYLQRCCESFSLTISIFFWEQLFPHTSLALVSLISRF